MYASPSWTGAEELYSLTDLYNAVEKCLFHADRCNDVIFTHYLKLIMDLILSRYTIPEDENDSHNDDSRT